MKKWIVTNIFMIIGIVLGSALVYFIPPNPGTEIIFPLIWGWVGHRIDVRRVKPQERI